MFSEENEVPWALSEARKVAGSATYGQSLTLYDIVLSFKVTLFFQSWKSQDRLFI